MRNYAIGNDKILVRVDEPLVEGYEEAKDVSQIKAVCEHPIRTDIAEGLVYKGARIPADLVRDILGTIRHFPHREVGFMLLYKGSEHKWKVQCPEQRGEGAFVTYKGTRDDDGYAEIGTIHTHPQMGAFWSGTDHANNAGKHGLHIVFGLTDGFVKTWKCTLYTVHNQYDQDLWHVMEQVPLDVAYPPRQEWVDIISRQSFRTQKTPESVTSILKPPTVGAASIGRITPKFELSYDRAWARQHARYMYDDDMNTGHSHQRDVDIAGRTLLDIIGDLLEDHPDIVAGIAEERGLENVLIIGKDIDYDQVGVETAISEFFDTLSLTPDRMIFILSTILWKMLYDYPTDLEECVGGVKQYYERLNEMFSVFGIKTNLTGEDCPVEKLSEFEAYQRVLASKIDEAEGLNQ